MRIRQECNILINDYLARNPIVYHDGYSEFLKIKLENFLLNLEPFDAPDMYSIFNQELLIIEHFRFDATKSNSKKENGFEIESRAKRASEDFFARDIDENQICEHIEDVSKKETTSDYLKNFSQGFDKHYNKISKYKENVLSKIKIQPTHIYMGFFIENEFPPLYMSSDFELMLTTTKQFLDKFEQASQLDFVLFGGYFDQKKRLCYIDKDMIAANRCKEIDLSTIDFLQFSEVSYNSRMITPIPKYNKNTKF